MLVMSFLLVCKALSFRVNIQTSKLWKEWIRGERSSLAKEDNTVEALKREKAMASDRYRTAETKTLHMYTCTCKSAQ